MTARDRVVGAAQSTTSAVQSAPGYASIGGAVTGVVLWALATYVFKSGVPSAVQGLAYIVIPAAVAGVASHLTRRYATPAGASPPPAAPAPSGPAPSGSPGG